MVPLKRSCIQRLHCKSSLTCMKTVLPKFKDTPGVRGSLKRASSTRLRQLPVEAETRRSSLQSDLLPYVHHRRLYESLEQRTLLDDYLLESEFATRQGEARFQNVHDFTSS